MDSQSSPGPFHPDPVLLWLVSVLVAGVIVNAAWAWVSTSPALVWVPATALALSVVATAPGGPLRRERFGRTRGARLLGYGAALAYVGAGVFASLSRVTLPVQIAATGCLWLVAVSLTWPSLRATLTFSQVAQGAAFLLAGAVFMLFGAAVLRGGETLFGVAGLLAGVAFLRGGETLVGVAGLLVGVTVLLVGVTVLRGGETLGGVAFLLGGVGFLLGGVAGLLAGVALLNPGGDRSSFSRFASRIRGWLTEQSDPGSSDRAGQ